MSLITYKPTGYGPVSQHSIAPRLSTFAGTRVGVLYNTKPNARELLVEIAQQLGERYPDVRLLDAVQTSSSMLSSQEQLQAIAQETDLVLTGLGD